MKVTQRTENNVLLISLDGQLLGGPDAETVRDLILSSLESGNRSILLDMDRVSWINSTGLGVLIAAHLAAKRREASLKLANVSGRIASILDVTRLSTIFEIVPMGTGAQDDLQSPSRGSA